MEAEIFEKTKIVSYYLWEHTGSERALDLWYCAEDLACYFEQMGILSVSRVMDLLRLGVYDPAYIHFLRHVSFRIYIYTGTEKAETNWYAAERLLKIGEWVESLVEMAVFFRNEKSNQRFIDGVRSENVRAYYDEQTFQNS